MKSVSEALQNILEPRSFSAQYSDKRWRECAKRHRLDYCESCKRRGVVLQVHHVNYTPGKMVWEGEPSDFATLCVECHDSIGKSIRAFRKTASRWNAASLCRLVATIQVMTDLFGDTETLLRLSRAAEKPRT